MAIMATTQYFLASLLLVVVEVAKTKLMVWRVVLVAVAVALVVF
tara:strand:+ start:221 stop:352 length:132 start_codon:yes stop_codon:yes gene_type:complete